MNLEVGQRVKLEGSPDTWIIVMIEKEEITVCHAQMESYELDVIPQDIEEVLEM